MNAGTKTNSAKVFKAIRHYKGWCVCSAEELEIGSVVRGKCYGLSERLFRIEEDLHDVDMDGMRLYRTTAMTIEGVEILDATRYSEGWYVAAAKKLAIGATVVAESFGMPEQTFTIKELGHVTESGTLMYRAPRVTAKK
ncbi:hypothetical protein LZC95_49975 [Pendulispora brunnea]|uniref:Uncharacterized protein n=1 Tax=Pendulispora brunnea TaxID=2905690 RepID=A0ABZ2K8X6_9BACT